MSFLDDAQNFLGERVDSLGVALDRRIDNELNDDFLPSPGNATPTDQTIVKTSDNQTGVSKIAGSGDSWVPGIDNKILIVGGVVALGALFWMIR